VLSSQEFDNRGQIDHKVSAVLSARGGKVLVRYLRRAEPAPATPQGA
jgi:hypothetical protein